MPRIDNGIKKKINTGKRRRKKSPFKLGASITMGITATLAGYGINVYNQNSLAPMQPPMIADTHATPTMVELNGDTVGHVQAAMDKQIQLMKSAERKNPNSIIEMIEENTNGDGYNKIELTPSEYIKRLYQKYGTYLDLSSDRVIERKTDSSGKGIVRPSNLQKIGT